MEANLRLNPLRVGMALAFAVAIMYSLCAVAWVIWNGAALDFLNALFHGLDFRRLEQTGTVLTFRSFFFPLCVMAVWAFVTGVLYSVIYNFMSFAEKST